MADRNRTAQAAGFDSYQDRLERQRAYVATGDRSLLPDGFDPSKIRTTKAEIAASPQSPTVRRLRSAMGIPKGQAVTGKFAPLKLRGTKDGNIGWVGNTSRAILAQVDRAPDQVFALTYRIRLPQGVEVEHRLVLTGAEWRRRLEQGSLTEIVGADMDGNYSADVGAGWHVVGGDFNYEG